MAVGDRRQAHKPVIAENLMLAAQRFPRRQPGHAAFIKALSCSMVRSRRVWMSTIISQ